MDTEHPFSFVFGGRHSSALLPEWTRTVETVDGGDVTAWLDPATGLEVRMVTRRHPGFEALDWTLVLTNTGEEDTPVIECVHALDRVAYEDAPEEVKLHRLRGSSCQVDDWLPFEAEVPVGERVTFGPTGGRSSNGACPFFNLSWDGGGVITALGWSGRWRATVHHGEDGQLLVQAGMERARLRLRPGESIRTPRVLQIGWQGHATEGYNQFRQLMLTQIMPQEDGRAVAPPIAHLGNSAYMGLDNKVTEWHALQHLEALGGLGFEVYWVDAFYTRGGFPRGIGNYGFPLSRAVDPERFPRGLRPIGDAAHSAGMGFLLWFEPERVADSTYLARRHPEWVLRAEGQHSGLLDLGQADARDHMTGFLTTAIEAYGLDWLRIDFNIDPLPFWRALDERDPDRVGMAEIRYVEGLYRMWDDIRAACPHVKIDNCASGGRRIDLETCSRSLPLWRSDTVGSLCDDRKFEQAALQNQVMTSGLSRYVPFSTSGQAGATPYLFRSAFNAGIPIMDDCRPCDYPREQLARAVAEGKRVRKYYFGNFYPLGEVTVAPTDWCVLQYHRPEQGDGMVIAFRRHQSPYSRFVCALHEIEEMAEYNVTMAFGYEAQNIHRLAGQQLRGIELAIEDCPGSVLVEYARV
jgi:alpha-galactosidase